MSRLPTARTTLLAAALAVGLTAAPAAAQTYQVRQGDTLGGIAARHRTSVAELARLNGLADPDRIIAGRRLQLPGAAGSAPAAAGSTHRVVPGESLGAIAARYGTSVRALAQLNGLASPDRILAGSTLQIPAAAPRAAAPPTAAPTTRPGQRHLVRAGESLSAIAARYGISAADLARWNGLTGSRIYAGTSLVLYEPGPLPAGTVTCPVPGASFFNDWGFPRPGGRVHEGNDLFAPRGTPVHAPVAGTVTTLTGRIGGLQFVLTEPSGDVWLGTHLDRFGATGPVQAGEVIGYVGDSGNALGSRPHLHLEYHPGGGPAVNAYPTLRAAC